MINLTDLTPFPPRPENEVPRDNVVVQLAGYFDANCQKQIISGKQRTGKTNLIAQFACHYSDRCISYFITDDPWTQRQYNFLFSLCSQLCVVLEEPSPPTEISLDNLKSLFGALEVKLNIKARKDKLRFFFAIDGLEWGIKGVEGERIVDVLPRTFTIGPYLLYSCQQKAFENLPSHVKPDKINEPLPFNQVETIRFLELVDFTSEEAKRIHISHKGNPGSLKAVYDAKNSDPSFSLDLALQEYDRVIENQVQFFIAQSPVYIRRALDYLSVCPTGLRLTILAGLLEFSEDELIGSLNSSTSSIYEIRDDRIEFQNEKTREIYLTQIGKEKEQYFDELLRFVDENYPDEEFLLTKLYIKANDYNGLKDQLSSSSVLTTINNPSYGVSSIIERLRSASQMASDEEDYAGLLRWSLGISAIKSYIDHSINHDEIRALIAIGDSKEALRKAYLLSDETNRIRFLAQVYSAMKSNDERVSIESKEELKRFVENLRINDLDEKLVQELAIDVFPILPDVSISLLEAAQLRSGENRVVELFALAISDISSKERDESRPAHSEKGDGKLRYDKVISDWFEDTPLAELEREISSIKSTKAKEQFVRQWCRQNQNSTTLAQGISIWLEVVKSDIDFVITLRELRQISGLLENIPVEPRTQLAHDLHIPAITSLDSPKQEWIKFNLNLAEALVETEYDESLARVIELLNQVLTEPLDLDVKTFCLANILSTLCRIFPDQLETKNKLDREFNTAFYSLIDNSADQYEILHETLGTYVEFDPDSALVMASELNTRKRTNQALVHILRVSLLKHGGENIREYLEDIIGQLEVSNKPDVFVNLLNELQLENVTLSQENLEILYASANSLEDPTYRAIALANLAVLMFPECPNRATELVVCAVESWENEEDLKISLSVGYSLVKMAAKIDLDFAKDLYPKVKDLHLLPGAPLATGSLGRDFVSNVELAIRAIAGLSGNTINNCVEIVENWITKIPAARIKGELYAKLASSLYRADVNDVADRIVRASVLPVITKLSSLSDRRDLIRTCLPVVYRFDETEAVDLSTELSNTQRDEAWFSTLVWTLANCYLSDVPTIDSMKLKILADRPKLLKAIDLAGKLKHDVAINIAVETITNIIDRSFRKNRLNPTQALELLGNLEELVKSSLPDSDNIKHEGYLILSQAEIHRVKSMIFNLLSHRQSARGLNKADIGKRWHELINKAQRISNAADRVFVLSMLARKLKDYHKKATAQVTALLEQAQDEVVTIPDLLDRLNRLETIAESWHEVGNKSMAEFTVEQALDLLRQFEGVSRDQRLRAIVQTAYTIGDKQFASEVASQLDNPRPIEGMLTGPERVLKVEDLRKRPNEVARLLSTTNLLQEHEIILRSSADLLLEDLVIGQGKLDHPKTLSSWLLHSHDCHTAVIASVSNWIVENWVIDNKVDDFQIFQEAITLDARLAEAAFTVGREDIIESIEDSFAGLSSRYEEFRGGETERAQEWICRWITTNTHKYLKICDPYFGVGELKYLSCLPDNSMVLIVTTTRNMAKIERDDVRRHWQEISKRALPFVRFIIVPTNFDDRFHDRVIITDVAGLDLGCSLNGLGKSRQKVAILSTEEAKELESKYLKDMLDSTTWLMQSGVRARVLDVGDPPAA